MTPSIVACWVVVAVLAFGPPLDLPAIHLPPLFGPASGPRLVLIVHESNDDAPAFSAMKGELRSGANDAYLKSKGHTLTILDQNTPGPDKRSAPEIAKYGPFKPPELVIASLADGKALKREPCRFDAAFVMSELKANGG